MLIKNNEIYKLTEQDRAELMKEIGKFPMVIKLPPTAYTAPREYETELKRKSQIVSRRRRPLIHPIPMKAEVHTPTGIEFWQYSRIPASRNAKTETWKISDAFIELEDEMQLTERDTELAFFLAFKSSVRMGGKNTRTPRPLFMIENREKEVESTVKLGKIKSKVESNIYDKMHIDHVRVMAKSYGMGGVDLMGENELRHALVMKLAAKGLPAYEEFMTRLVPEKSGEDINRRTLRLALIQEAKDLKVIGTNKNNDKWHWLNDEGKSQGVICEHMAGYSMEQSLEFKVNTDSDLYDKIVESIKAKKVEAE